MQWNTAGRHTPIAQTSLLLRPNFDASCHISFLMDLRSNRSLITAYSSNFVNERLNFDNNLIKTEASMHFIA